ncbi:hypothetical protein lacNasYZ02_15980 [Lactobacillus nasalidis]|nr:hypothetical protein lacNasYZ01_00590 [Lactobacillus nasalidis]GHW00169.1 hypothetical protein lacNasYZ02_15980 [Lactobacillus nasalidis]
MVIEDLPRGGLYFPERRYFPHVSAAPEVINQSSAGDNLHFLLILMRTGPLAGSFFACTGGVFWLM